MHTKNVPLSDRAAWWVRGTLSLLAAGVVAACGGGDVDLASAPTVSTSAYTSGTITGFGSVIVNGVRFDDSGAEVQDDDGARRSVSALKLGASVEIDSGTLDRVLGQAKALRIRYGSAVLGPVEAVNTSASTVTVLGQTVGVSDTTVFETGLSGLAALTVGQVVEIHGQYSSTGTWAATRIDDETGATVYRLRGAVAGLNTTAKTFQLGSAVVSYAAATAVTSALADGVQVRVRLQTTPVSGQWLATSVDSGKPSVASVADGEVHGLITAWTSATSFTVNNLPVDASAATFPDGSAGVVLGARVEVSGAVVGGVLVATRVHVEDAAAHKAATAAGRYELHGALSALDTTAKTFSLRGLTVDYSAVVEWRKLTEASLANGLNVEVKGALSTDGTRVTARRIQLDN